jgi:pimeloyl-ACP methyl ester carboxylesterase
LHYDPAIAEPFRAMTADTAASGGAMLWQIYDQLRCQMLIVRGQDSDLLTADTAHAMTQRGPKGRLFEVPGVGHAPTLIASDQVMAIKDFLLA